MSSVVQPDQTFSSSMALVGSYPLCQPSSSGHVNPAISGRFPTPSTQNKMKIQLKEIVDQFPWIPTIERPCCWNLKTCCIAQGWLILVLSLLTIIWVGQAFKDNCITGNAMVHMTSYSSNYWTELAYCEGYFLFEYLLGIIVNGIIQLSVSGLFLLGINKGHSDWFLPYVMFLHLKIITDLHHCVFLISDRARSPAALTACVVFLLMCLDVFFIVCANSLRLHVKTNEEAHRPQAATRVVQGLQRSLHLLRRRGDQFFFASSQFLFQASPQYPIDIVKFDVKMLRGR